MRAPAVERSEPEHELSELERLRQVVVGADLEAGLLVIETVGSGEHQDRHATGGGDDAFCDLVTRRPWDVPVENGDVVRVEAQKIEGRDAVGSDVCGDRLQAEAVADGFRHQGLVLHDQHAHPPMLERAHIAGISKTAYRPATPRWAGWTRGSQQARTNRLPVGLHDPSDPDSQSPRRDPAAGRRGDRRTWLPSARVLVPWRRFADRAPRIAWKSGSRHGLAGVRPGRVH